MEPMKKQAGDYLRDESNWTSALLAKMENQTKIPRQRIAGVLAVLFSVYMVFGEFAQLVCNFIGFAYPAYASMVAIESSDKNDDTQWLMYWTVYAVLSLVDFAADIICGWFPMYWLAKSVVYLYHPQTMGARDIYPNCVRPLLPKCSGAVNFAGAVIQEGQQAVAAAASSRQSSSLTSARSPSMIN